MTDRNLTEILVPVGFKTDEPEKTNPPEMVSA